MSVIEIKVYRHKQDYFAEFLYNDHKFTTNRYSDKAIAIREAKHLHKYLIDRDNDYKMRMLKPKHPTDLKRRTIPELVYMLYYNKIKTNQPPETMTKRKLVKILADNLL